MAVYSVPTWQEPVALVDVDDVTRGSRMYDVLVDARNRVGDVMGEHLLPLGAHLGTLGQHAVVPTARQPHRTSTQGTSKGTL